MDYPWNERIESAKEHVLELAKKIPLPPDDIIGLKRRAEKGTLSEDDEERLWNVWIEAQDAFEAVHHAVYGDVHMVRHMFVNEIISTRMVDLHVEMMKYSQVWTLKVLREGRGTPEIAKIAANHVADLDKVRKSLLDVLDMTLTQV